MVSVYIKTFGCSNNQAESEIMAGLLERAGFVVTRNIYLAEIVIVNTCIVKEPTENRVVDYIKFLQQKHKDKKLIIAGCMPEAEYGLASTIAPDASMVGTNHITEIAIAAKKTAEGKKVELIGKHRCEKVLQPKIRSRKIIDIIPISSGCLGSCSYCITKLAKGELFSFDQNKIVKQIELSKKAGCKEFWLTSQDCGCYGLDINTNLAELLKKILENVKGKCFLRIGMMNPTHLKNFCQELFDIYEDERIFKFLHIPIQSGSDSVLKNMNRGYTVSEFKQIVNAFYERFPNGNLVTDVIVGFPDETKQDHEKTMSLLKEIKPDFVNISKFGARPGTKAAKMEQLPNDLVKQRSTEMTELVKKVALEKNQNWLHWSGKVIIDEYNQKNKNYVARNQFYKPIIICDDVKIGDIVNVEIIETGRILRGILK